MSATSHIIATSQTNSQYYTETAGQMQGKVISFPIFTQLGVTTIYVRLSRVRHKDEPCFPLDL
ncbi:hypothetical protein MU1_54380 [Paenibacillus glycanilyticus]|uniref:Uncharacterized protein n=1 Tax=Paenibacillus glycanilyticus TaxID=126569 RepID=A0ABQ6GJF9_9BACL|nr:hypothetical protein MU1_54380 [Paenibacillus glycanilyticus]